MRFLGTLLAILVSFSAVASESVVTSSSARPSFQEPFSTEAVSQLILGLLLVMAVIFAFFWLLKRFSGFAPITHNMKVIGVLPLTTREKAVLVKVGDTQMLLGVAPGRVSHLHTFDEPVVESDVNSVSFAERLSEVMKKAKEQKGEE